MTGTVSTVLARLRKAVTIKAVNLDPQKTDALVTEVKTSVQAIINRLHDGPEPPTQTPPTPPPDLTAVLAWARNEYKLNLIAARCTTSRFMYAICNGRLEGIRQVTNQLTTTAGLTPVDWEQIKRDVPADGMYR
ncbi:hypothetical protein [Actinoplanes sp. NBRC 101535]|uniref:hypothetical protein n=1 Tax=Actinoplanes sp. NBRC 101535 TaxID=3032196 RepID=UPI0024A4B9D2|nr:hypothetical protein [Actinoplanes sp. NBRC 101535]GLY08294.1 hypothetical protein Acsp01_86730 [Actinoplanes sp. NBRC 101535]